MIAGHARAAGRILLLAVVTVVICLVWLPFGLATRHDRGADLARRARLTHRWCRTVARVLGMRVRLTGRPPKAPFLLVSNHLGYIDVVLLGSIVEGLFVAKQEVSRWPVVGRLSLWSGALYIDRRPGGHLVDSVAQAQDVLSHGVGLIVFPEGTSTAGDRVLPFRSALLEPAVSTRVPVWHACIRYVSWDGSPAAEEALCWWRDMTFTPHLYNLLQLPGFDATVRFGEAPLVGEDRKELARSLWTAVSSDLRGESVLEAT